ncbi:MAG: NAD(P)-dependent glycerol-3-phosphate dehydrogenase, partial [Cyanobacteria bacterium REEB65]|nr:NAD(P)-dependent glycerol-3-phosphate dehydrogenase [Cyanobacteria bacterium REEB65]
LLIHGVKGLEPVSFKRMTQVLAEETCCRKIGALSGPNLAKEVAHKQPSATVVASASDEVVHMGRKLLWCPSFRVYGSRDVIGVELAGAIKNVMAIATGLAQGLGFGMNTLALLLTRGLAEIARLGVAEGARLETFQGLAGIGDLMATCFSPLSRNYQVGSRLARGESLEEILASLQQVAEGVATTRTVHEMAQARGVYMPITDGAYQVLFEGVAPKTVLAGLMDYSRSVYEFDQTGSP